VRVLGLATTGVLAVSVTLATLTLGCSSQNPDHPDSPSDAGADVTMGQPVWTTASRRITLACQSFISGVMGFDADRAQLTEQQLTLLDALRTGPLGTQIEDGIGCSVEITGADGNITAYLAVQQDGAANDNTPLINYATFQPFLAAIPCLFSADEGAQHAIAPDVRCVNGIYLRPSPGNVDRFLTITDPVPQRHFELDQCDVPDVAGLLHLQVLGDDGADGGTTTVLGQATAPPAPTSVHTCQILDVTFPAAGTYRLRVVVDAGVSAATLSHSAFRFF